MKITIANLRRLIREALTTEEADVPGRWRASNGEPVDDEDMERLGTGGFEFPVDSEEEFLVPEGDNKKPGLWANIHARRKAGKRPKRPGEKGYPKTLDLESQAMQGHEDPSYIAQMNHQGDGFEYDQMGKRKR
jgi:hypothetical protein